MSLVFDDTGSQTWLCLLHFPLMLCSSALDTTANVKGGDVPMETCLNVLGNFQKSKMLKILSIQAVKLKTRKLSQGQGLTFLIPALGDRG